MCGVTCNFEIRNEHIRRTTRMAQASENITDTIVLVWACDEERWRTHTEEILRTNIPGKRRRGRPNQIWKDA